MMHYLLALSALLLPALATAQDTVQLYAHPRLYTLRPGAHFYASLNDILHALATDLSPSQVVAARTSTEYRWALVSNVIGSSVGPSNWMLISDKGTIVTSWYVRREDLIMVPEKHRLPATQGLD
jgi:hypothetical protein